MKKITLVMIASASMLLAAPAMDSNMNMQGKGMKVMQKSKACQGKDKQCNKNRMKKNMKKNMKNSPFLIKHGLPHLSKIIMPYMNDPSFNLTANQKDKLTKVRVDTMGVIMETKPKVIALRKEIVNASTSGTNARDLKDKVVELALLEATATMAHLKCIDETKKILTKDQLLFLFVKKNNKHGKKARKNKGEKSMRNNR